MQPASAFGQMAETSDRAALVARGKRLEYFTIGWNVLEAVVALLSGLAAGSIALLGFGFDSLIETASAVALLWRLRADHDAGSRERAERQAYRVVGACFLALSIYILYESIEALWLHEAARRSLPGILLAATSVVVMPFLGRAKRKVAAQLKSRALHSDSRQADFCAYLSAILLAGLTLQWILGWWWADPVAALIMVPIIAHEGVKGLRGHACDDCCD
jgi:divalent metal cation (Fe/Co/Zn/Cd) transporter